MKKPLLVIILMSIAVLANAQDYQPKSKRISKANVKTVKVEKKSYDVGHEETELLEAVTYNEDGDVTEVKEWKNNKLSKHEKYEYNSEGDIVLETEFDLKGKLGKKVEYKYNSDRLVTERIVYFSNGKVKSRRVYSYTYQD